MAPVSLVELLPSTTNKTPAKEFTTGCEAMHRGMGKPYKDRSQEPLAPGGTRVARVTLLEGVQCAQQGREGPCLPWGEADSQKKNEGLPSQEGGREEVASHSPAICFGPGRLKSPV